MADKELDLTIVDDLADYIRRFVILPTAEHATVLALWIMHTWAFESSRATPYLYINSREKRAGKTRLIEVLEIFVRNPIRATHTTPQALFRSIEVLKPTILLDEMDTVFAGSKNNAMTGIINGGYKQGGSVLRIQNQQPKLFNTFCPKLLAGIFNGFLPDTLIDRCIPITLQRKERGQECEVFYQIDAAQSQEVERLLSRIEAFVAKHALDVAIQRPAPIEAVNDRQWEICEPLVSLAIVLGIEDAIRKLIPALFADLEDSPSIVHQLLEQIRAAFGDREKLFSQDLLDTLGGAWTAKLVSQWLAPYDIHPTLLRVGNRVAHGYKKSDFEHAWASL